MQRSEWYEAGRAAHAADPQPVDPVALRKAAVILRRHLKIETAEGPGVTTSPSVVSPSTGDAA